MRHIIIALLIAVATNVMAQEKKLKVYGIGFYNLENLWADAQVTSIPDIA